MATEPNGSEQQNTTIPPYYSSTPDPEELAKKEMVDAFYKTYDVMTGVRIAATLGGFFGLMVILVLYKSKSKTERALEDPNFTAAAVAEVEEEERQLAAALEATVYQQLNPRRARRSLDIASMPPTWTRTNPRFSSVGGYSSLMEPPTRTHSRLPCFFDEDSTSEGDPSLYDDVCYNQHLDVPRRASNLTCSSSGSSYLERRDSAVAIGFPVLPGHKSRSRRRQSSPLLEIYDFYYPIDIKVIQPTPSCSPCGSERTLYDRVVEPPHLAPLASISSCNSSLGADYTDLDVASYTSDSVFKEDPDSTDDEVEQFSTDSDSSALGACYARQRKKCTAHPPDSSRNSIHSSKSSITIVDKVEPEPAYLSDTPTSPLGLEDQGHETLF